jgi:hypothetical protein
VVKLRRVSTEAYKKGQTKPNQLHLCFHNFYRIGVMGSPLYETHISRRVPIGTGTGTGTHTRKLWLRSNAIPLPKGQLIEHPEDPSFRIVLLNLLKHSFLVVISSPHALIVVLVSNTALIPYMINIRNIIFVNLLLHTDMGLENELVTAAHNGDLIGVKKAIKGGANVNYQDEVNQSCYYQALFFSFKRNLLLLLIFLIDLLLPIFVHFLFRGY